jgi:hypothetical protein
MATKAKPGQSYTEESFGHHIPEINLRKGSIAVFGDTINNGPYPSARPTSVNQKTGWPGNEKA